MLMNKPSLPRPQRGITLIESLVALIVAALGILGIAGVQMRTLTDTQTTVRRAQAIRLIEDLGERMRVHPNALLSATSYLTAFDEEPPLGNCAVAACTQTALAIHDLAAWKKTVRDSLPLGKASVFLAPAETDATNRRQLGVIIAWRENEREGAKTDDIDATQVRAADGSLSSGTGVANACPSEHTCHLQYIPMAARCTSYFAGAGSSAQVFCPGS